MHAGAKDRYGIAPGQDYKVAWASNAGRGGVRPPPNCFIIEDFHPQLGSGQEHWQIHLDGFPKSRECHVQIILEFLEFMKVLKPRMTLCDMQFYTLTIRIASIM